MLKLWNKDRIAKASDVLQVISVSRLLWFIVWDDSEQLNVLPCGYSQYRPK